MIAYLLLTNISRMFSSMPGLAGGIAREIREGTMKRYMIQPIDLIGYLLVYRVAHKVTYIIASFLPYFLLFFLCRGFFDGFPDLPTLGAFAVSLVLSFLVGFFFEACVGMVGFWFLEVTSLLYIVMTLNFFISGHMLPLDLLPEPWSRLAEVPAVSVHGVFPGRRVPGQGQGNDARVFPRRRAGLDCFLHGAGAVSLPARPAALQRLRRLDAVAFWQSLGRYLRLLGSLARYTLYREMAFRGNFLVKVSVEVLWLAIMVAFYRTVFARTSTIAGWTEPQYFFFVGCFFAMNGVIEMLFLDNCNEFAELVRTGDLDGLLAQADRRTVPDHLPPHRLGNGTQRLDGRRRDGDRALPDGLAVRPPAGRDAFWSRSSCGTAIAYSFMLLLTSVSVWMVRNQSLMEMWWLFSSVARYPREIFAGRWAEPLGTFFTYLHADSGRRERAGECDGAGARPAGGGGHDRRGRGAALAEPAVLSVRAPVVSQREQLKRASADS